MGKSSINGPFSMAMLNYQRVPFTIQFRVSMKPPSTCRWLMLAFPPGEITLPFSPGNGKSLQ